MMQVEMFDTNADTTFLYRTGQETSKEAIQSHKSRETHCKMVLEAIKKYPGCTSLELSTKLNIDRVECGRRTSDLRNQGKVYNPSLPDGKPYKKKCSVNGKNAIIWVSN